MRPRKGESREDFIARLVKSWPRLTRGQRARLAELLRADGPPETLGANKANPAGHRHHITRPPDVGGTE